MKKSLISKVALCSAGLAMVLGLAGCGSNSSSAKSGSNDAKSSQVTESAADKAYQKANTLITAGSYKKAYNLLDNVQNTNKKVDYLESDLQNYLDARADYQKGNYREAESELPGMKSNSQPMKKAYKALRIKIVKAINGGSTSNSTQSGNSTSSTTSRHQSNSSSTTSTQGAKTSSATSNTTTSTQTPANAQAASQTSEDVVSGFANKNGFNKKGYGIIPVSKNGNTYRFEVRKNNADNTVANMVGIYEYNSSTGSTTKVN